MLSNITLIINPTSGGGRGARIGPRLAERLRSEGAHVRTRCTSGRGDAIVLAAQAVSDGVDVVVAVAGDGTVNEVTNGLLSAESGGEQPRLVIVPCGTGNDVARGLSLRYWEGGLDDLRTGFEQPMDAVRVSYVTEDGTLGLRTFINAADLGLGGRTVIEAAKHRKRLGGTGAFLYGALLAILHAENPRVRVVVDGDPLLEEPVSLVVIANGRYFASGMHVAPQADPSDGLLDVLVLRETPRWRMILDLLPRVYLGAHLGHARVTVARGRHVTVHSASQLPLEMDGELVGTSDVELTVLPGAITVLVPRAVPGGRSRKGSASP